MDRWRWKEDRRISRLRLTRNRRRRRRMRGQYGRNWRAKPDAQLSRGGRSSGANLEAQVAVNRRSKMEPRILEESKKGRMKEMDEEQKEAAFEGERGEVTEMPFGLNGSEVVGEGFGAPTKEKGEKITKVIVVDVNGSEGRNGFGAPKNEKEEKPTRITVDVNGSYWPVRYIGSESGLVANIEKRVSDLKMGGGNPNPNRRGRGRGFGNWGHGGGRPSVSSGRGPAATAATTAV